MWVTQIARFLLLFLFQDLARGYIEHVTTSGCESCALRLTCRHLNSIIAILEATFEANENAASGNNNNNSSNGTFPTVFPPVHPRTALNERCSGVNHCSFILIKDCPGAETWGLGNLTVKYACIAERRITKYCNKEILLPSPETLDVSQGFIHNPGYPRYYLGKQECRWKIQAPPLQRVKITIFDISLVGDPDIQECSDFLRVSDSGQTLYTTCEQQEPPVDVISLGDTLDVTLVPSKTENLLPRRGVLFYYSALGCPTPRAPKDGYLVYRNDTAAEFSCCVGFGFPDTRTRRRIIKCLGHKWDVPLPLPDCDRNVEITESSLLSTVSKRRKLHKHKMVEKSSLEEIIIPTIIMVSLFLINSIVLFVIYKYRQRKDAECTEEELGTLPVANNKNSSTA